MEMKSIILVTLLVVVLAASQGDAQILGLLQNISGTVFCSLNGSNIPNSPTPTPAFPNALVQLNCGGNVISSTLTSQTGGFSIILSPLQSLITTLLSSCSLVVATPLATCNASLPATGFLQSPLQLIGSAVRGLFSILNFAPGVFQLIGV